MGVSWTYTHYIYVHNNPYIYSLVKALCHLLHSTVLFLTRNSRAPLTNNNRPYVGTVQYIHIFRYCSVLPLGYFSNKILLSFSHQFSLLQHSFTRYLSYYSRYTYICSDVRFELYKGTIQWDFNIVFWHIWIGLNLNRNTASNCNIFPLIAWRKFSLI